MMKKLIRHVLLADDDIDDCDFFSAIFSEKFPDIKLSVSYDGSKLLTLLDGPPHPSADVIFLDLNMPLVSGVDCLKKIRESQHLKQYIVIIFTTSSSPTHIEKMYELGSNYFITKLADYTKLSKLIIKAMELVTSNALRQPSFDDFYITI